MPHHMKIRRKPLAHLTRLWYRLFPRPCYVIVYDRFIEPGTDETVEEYYGYFSSPTEARAIWDTYQEGIIGHENVKLCRVVENWS